MTKRWAARANGRKPKTADKRRKGVSPLNGVEPPPEHRFRPGNTAAVGHGRPRKLADFQELIKDTLAEELHLPEGILTRAQAMIRTMLIKSPSDRIALLEYAFGKVPQHLMVEDVTDKPDNELVAELQSILDTAATSAGAGDSGGTPSAGAGGNGGDPAPDHA